MEINQAHHIAELNYTAKTNNITLTWAKAHSFPLEFEHKLTLLDAKISDA